MAEFIKGEQADVADDLRRRGVSEQRTRFITDKHNLTLSDMAAEDGHTDLAGQLRRKIGD